MIEILTEGKKKFVFTCNNCDAVFSYELNDIICGIIYCPCCREICNHYNHRKEESEEGT